MQLQAVFDKKTKSSKGRNKTGRRETKPMLPRFSNRPGRVGSTASLGFPPSIPIVLRARGPGEGGPLQVLCVDDAGAGVLAGLQLHRGDEPAAGAARVVAERGAVRALGVLGVNDGGAPVADGLLPRLQVHLGFVAPPGAVAHGHHRLAVGDGRGERGAVDLVPEVSVRVVLDLRVAPSGRRDAAVRLDTQGGRVETAGPAGSLT